MSPGPPKFSARSTGRWVISRAPSRSSSARYLDPERKIAAPSTPGSPVPSTTSPRCTWRRVITRERNPCTKKRSQSERTPSSPNIPPSRSRFGNLGLLHWAKADWDQAEAYLARVAEVEERQISLLLPVQLVEDRARAFMEALSNTTNLILSFQSKRPDQRSTTRLALTTILRRKGRQLSGEVGESAALQRRLGDEERAVFDKLLARRNELGRLILRKSDRSRSKSLRESVEKLRREVDDLEKAAASGGAALRSWAAPIQIEDLQSRIPADAALVELVEYQDLDPTRISSDRARGIARLAAFVLRSTGEPRWVPLGEAAAIDASVRAFREALVDTEVSPKKLRERARDLYDRLAAPLEPHLEGIRTVLVAPDGAAVLVPFGALIDPGWPLLGRAVRICVSDQRARPVASEFGTPFGRAAARGCCPGLRRGAPGGKGEDLARLPRDFRRKSQRCIFPRSRCLRRALRMSEGCWVSRH